MGAHKKDKLPKEGEPYKMIRLVVRVTPNSYRKIQYIQSDFGIESESAIIQMAIQLLIQKHYVENK